MYSHLIHTKWKLINSCTIVYNCESIASFHLWLPPVEIIQTILSPLEILANKISVCFKEYDEYLEEQKLELVAKKLMANTDIVETRKMEREIDQSDQEVRWRFLQQIDHVHYQNRFSSLSIIHSQNTLISIDRLRGMNTQSNLPSIKK